MPEKNIKKQKAIDSFNTGDGFEVVDKHFFETCAAVRPLNELIFPTGLNRVGLHYGDSAVNELQRTCRLRRMSLGDTKGTLEPACMKRSQVLVRTRIGSKPD